MRTGSRLFRLSLLLASTSLSLSATMPAFAQPAPPAGAEAPNGNAGDPPALAGRLSNITGTVSYHPAGADQWSPATQNFPVTSGNAYWTEPQATATIEIGDDVMVMDGGTELDVTTLDQTQFIASAPQGAIFLCLRDLPDGRKLTVTTPRGAVEISQSGQYEIVAGDTNNPTSVTVAAGAAHITATGVDLNIGANQTGAVTGSDQLQGGVSAAEQDQFMQTQLAACQPPAQAAPPAVAQRVRYMTGGQDLARYGSWSQSQQYGQLWHPSGVASDWAPYRNGHWAYVQPWGWNWVDDAPWGFAPFHYGRWINDGGQWGWMASAPDESYDGGYPVYAPALVSFVGIGGDVLAGAAIGFGAGLLAGGGGIGWFPLGYREPFVPWYHVSDGYFRNINRYSGFNYRNVMINNYRNVTINNYSNRRFAVVAPDRAFARGERMGGFARPLPEAALAHGRPFGGGRLPVTPTAQTPGLNREAARRYGVNLPARGNGAAGAGPAIHGGGFGHGRPALRPAGLPGNVKPAVGALPGHGGGPGQRPGSGPDAGLRPGAGSRPGAGLPGLRPGADSNRPGGQPGAGRPGRPGGAPGPAINRPGPAGTPGARPGLPALRPASPGEAAPGVGRLGLTHPGSERPASERPGSDRPGQSGERANRPAAGMPRPGAGRADTARPGTAAPNMGRPGATRPDEAGEGIRSGVAKPPAAGAGRPASPAGAAAADRGAGRVRPEQARPSARPEHAPRPATPHAEGRPAPRPAAVRPAAPRPAAPRMERPAPRPEPRPAARPAAPPRPQPRPAAPRPAPHPGPEHKK